jgi:hypothetical protein
MKEKFQLLFETGVNFGTISWTQTEHYCGGEIKQIEHSKVVTIKFKACYHLDFNLLVVSTFDRWMNLPKFIEDQILPKRITVFEGIESRFEACDKAVEFVKSFNQIHDGKFFEIPETPESPLDPIPF